MGRILSDGEQVPRLGLVRGRQAGPGYDLDSIDYLLPLEQGAARVGRIVRNVEYGVLVSYDVLQGFRLGTGGQTSLLRFGDGSSLSSNSQVSALEVWGLQGRSDLSSSATRGEASQVFDVSPGYFFVRFVISATRDFQFFNGFSSSTVSGVFLGTEVERGGEEDLLQGFASRFPV